MLSISAATGAFNWTAVGQAVGLIVWIAATAILANRAQEAHIAKDLGMAWFLSFAAVVIFLIPLLLLVGYAA